MRTGRPPTPVTATVLALTLLALVGLAGCAPSNATRGTSFTSLSAAAEQARTWVDGAVATAVPTPLTKATQALPSEACDSASGRNAARYEVTTTTTPDAVDPAARAAWKSLAEAGFVLSAASAPPSGTDPVAPGPGSPSWTITGTHDGFQAEVMANRSDPAVRVRVITPCFGT